VLRLSRTEQADCQVGIAFACTNAYGLCRLPDEDVPLTAFKTPMGLFQYRVIPFGLSNAPTVFQGVMQRIFGDLMV
jgi:hypothetical protein